MTRWRISHVPEGTLARRAASGLNLAFKLVPPRVAHVLFRSWINGWCTARRFQVRHAPCLFACAHRSSDGCFDSIEHYAHCRTIRAFAQNVLHLSEQDVGNMQGFLCLRANVGNDERTLQLLLLYAVYTATNILRFSDRPPPEEPNELLLQLVHQGASQSSNAQQIVLRTLALQTHKRRRTSAAVAQALEEPSESRSVTAVPVTGVTRRMAEPQPDTRVVARSASTLGSLRTRFVQGRDHFMTTSSD